MRPPPLLVLRRAIHMGRIIPDVDPILAEKIEENSVNLKQIVTRRNVGMVRLPARLHSIVEAKLRSYSDKAFRNEARYLNSIIRGLKLPDEEHTISAKKADIRNELELRGKIKSDPDHDPQEFRMVEDKLLAQDELSQLITGTLIDRRRDWHYYEYNERAAHLYMATRLAPNYACLRTVMKEIHDLDPDFKPRSVLDYGSGMGTSIWAITETWPNEVSEYMNVDISSEQQYLCEYLLRGGKHSGQQLPGIFHRQYLPSSNKVKYDLVVAAFSMLELPNSEMRAHAIENLWQKTNDLLVIIERGNRGGFTIVNEARHFILDLSGHDVTKKLQLTLESRPTFKLKEPEAHVFAPCSHEFTCPRAQMPKKKNMDICRFNTYYEPLEFGESKPGVLKEEFSYVVLRKGPHPNYDASIDGDCSMRWPRIVEKRKAAGGQITHKLCCPNGNIAETTVTAKKYGKPCFELAKACDWGDLFPIKVKDTYVSRNSKLIKG